MVTGWNPPSGLTHPDQEVPLGVAGLTGGGAAPGASTVPSAGEDTAGSPGAVNGGGLSCDTTGIARKRDSSKINRSVVVAYAIEWTRERRGCCEVLVAILII